MGQGVDMHENVLKDLDLDGRSVATVGQRSSDLPSPEPAPQKAVPR